MFLTQDLNLRIIYQVLKNPLCLVFISYREKKLIFLLMKITIQSEVNGVLMKKIEKKIPKEFNFPKHIKNTETKHTEFLKKTN